MLRLLSIAVVCCGTFWTFAAEPSENPAYHHNGALAGSLTSAKPLPLYDKDPGAPVEPAVRVALHSGEPPAGEARREPREAH